MTALAVLDAAPAERRQADCANPAPWPRPHCPECLTPLLRARPGQLFCCTDHKRAYNNRWLKRGGVVAVIYAAARQTRGGTRGPEVQRAIGRRARSDAEQALQRWRDEDAAANRMPALEYLALRYRHGLVDVVR